MRRIFHIIALFFFCMGVSLDASAQPNSRGGNAQRGPAQAGRVQLDVLVVHATNAHQDIDERVTPYLRYLRHLAYTGYTPIRDLTLNLSANRVERFELAGGRRVVVELLERDERRARLRIQIIGQRGSKLLDTTMSVSRDASVIVAGPTYDGGILVLPLTARY